MAAARRATCWTLELSDCVPMTELIHRWRGRPVVGGGQTVVEPVLQ